MKKLILLLLLALPIITFGQSRKVWLNDADKYFEVQDYQNALINYNLALSDSSGMSMMVLPYDINISKQKLKNKEHKIGGDTIREVPLKDYLEHQIATCYLNTYDYKRAISQFEHTSSFKSYPEDVYHFAVSQMNVDQHDKAIINFEKYIKSNHYNDSLLRSAQLSITGCYYALDKDNQREKVSVKLADTNVFNSGTSSFAAMYFENESRVLFTSARDGGVIFDPEKQESEFLCDLYWAEKNSKGEWQNATNFGRPLNTAQHDASGSFSNNNIIYYTRWNDANRKDKNIYLARMVDFKFYESFKLPAAVNVEGYKSINPFVTMDSKWLYFSSNRPGGEGGMDLWKIKLDETGNVTGEALNLGRPINSELDEVTPFYHEISSTLFFSSNGHNSIGGLDVYKASYHKDNSSYNKPENMGMPINSSKDDAYMIWDDRLDKGFLSSDREDCPSGHCYDIYEVSNEPLIIVLKGNVFDAETDEIIPNANLKFKDILVQFEPFDIVADADGFYSIELKNNQDIFIKASKIDYFSNAGTVNTFSITESTTIIKDFYLSPISKDEIEIDGIEYDLNSSILRPKSKEILDELFNFLEFNSGLIVQINSHTDYRGSDKYNLWLSERRAQSCVDYLISKGIHKERLVAKGYGETSPNYLKDEDKKAIVDADGKRTYLTKDFIDAEKSEELVDKYHQRNRRTAFKVLGDGFELKSK